MVSFLTRTFEKWHYIIGLIVKFVKVDRLVVIVFGYTIDFWGVKLALFGRLEVKIEFYPTSRLSNSASRSATSDSDMSSGWEVGFEPESPSVWATGAAGSAAGAAAGSGSGSASGSTSGSTSGSGTGAAATSGTTGDSFRWSNFEFHFLERTPCYHASDQIFSYKNSIR